VSYEVRRWLYHARCADSHEERTFLESTEDSIQIERLFAKPANMRAYPAAAFAPGKVGCRVIDARIAKWRSSAPIAAALKKLAVHVDDIHRPCLLVQVVYILRAEEEAISELFPQIREREVSRVGFRYRSYSPPHRVELPHEPGITSPSLGRGDLFDPVVAP
jgi:hypothetical protein